MVTIEEISAQLVKKEKFSLEEMLDKNNATDKKNIEDFTCSICLGTVQDPRKCIECDNVFCNKCISVHLKKSKECPNCREEFKAKQLTGVLRKVLMDLTFKCQRCDRTIEYENAGKHLEQNCHLNCPAGCQNRKFSGQKELAKHLQVECEKIIRTCLCCRIVDPTLILKMDKPCKKTFKESQEMQQAVQERALEAKFLAQANFINLKKLQKSEEKFSQAKKNQKEELKKQAQAFMKKEKGYLEKIKDLEAGKQTFNLKEKQLLQLLEESELQTQKTSKETKNQLKLRLKKFELEITKSFRKRIYLQNLLKLRNKEVAAQLQNQESIDSAQRLLFSAQEKAKAKEATQTALLKLRKENLQMIQDAKYFKGIDQMAKKYASQKTYDTYKKYQMKFLNFNEHLEKVQPTENLNFEEWTQIYEDGFLQWRQGDFNENQGYIGKAINISEQFIIARINNKDQVKEISFFVNADGQFKEMLHEQNTSTLKITEPDGRMTKSKFYQGKLISTTCLN